MRSTDNTKLAALYESQSFDDYYENTEKEKQKEDGKRKVAREVWKISKNAFEKLATGRNSISPERANAEPTAQELLKVGKEIMNLAWRNYEKDTPEELLRDPATLKAIIAAYAESPLQSRNKAEGERKFRG